MEVWIIYVATILMMMSTPGPSQLLMLSNSAAHGFRKWVATVAGDLTANALQMLAAGFGLAAVLMASASALMAVKWLGASYLMWLGFRMIRKAGIGGMHYSGHRPLVSLKTLWFQGFMTSAANPKAVVFFAALFPQFISPDAPFASQFVLLSATYILVDGIFLSAYGIGADWMAARFKGTARTWIERIGGSFMILAAVLLGLKTINE